MLRHALAAPVPVLPFVGAGARSAVLALHADPRLELVASPRHATVLLVAGAIPRRLLPALAHVHDQLPHPRVTVWWTGALIEAGLPEVPADAVMVPADADLVSTLVGVRTRLLAGDRATEAALLPADNPVTWQGVGPHGQGGEGMTGGTPYGRSMPMTGPDRDGLQLDRWQLTFGPNLPGLPPGLTLDVTMQGDVIQELAPATSPFVDGDEPAGTIGAALDPPAPQRGPRRIAELERARTHHHLHRTAEVLRLVGLDALARRTLRVAGDVATGDLAGVPKLARRLGRPGVLRGALAGVGLLGDVSALRGPAARAAGRQVDARAAEDAYARLGFQTITHDRGDALARVRQWLAEAAQSASLAALAGDATVARGALMPGTDADDHRAEVVHDTAVLLRELPDLLAGSEWGDAITTIASLGLDLEAVTARDDAVVA